MRAHWKRIVILTVVAALCVGSAALAGEKHKSKHKNVWVSNDEHVMALHGHHGAKLIAGDGEVFDLAELADGETRVFGEGAKQITAMRDDGIVTILRDENGEDDALEIKCQIDKDSCQVMTFEDDPEKVMVILKKTRTCIDGEGDCEATIDVHLDQLDLGEGGHAVIRKVHCDDEGDCEEFETLHGGAELEIIADVHHGGDGEMVIVRANEMKLDEGGHVMALHGHHGAKFIAGDGEVFDLAELADGETRVFGGGAKQVTAMRDDGIVTILRDENGEDDALEIKCQIDKDSCQVMTFEDEPEKVMVILKKTRTCIDGEGDCEATIDVHLDQLDLGEGGHATIRKIIVKEEGD